MIILNVSEVVTTYWPYRFFSLFAMIAFPLALSFYFSDMEKQWKIFRIVALAAVVLAIFLPIQVPAVFDLPTGRYQYTAYMESTSIENLKDSGICIVETSENTKTVVFQDKCDGILTCTGCGRWLGQDAKPIQSIQDISDEPLVSRIVFWAAMAILFTGALKKWFEVPEEQEKSEEAPL